MNLNNNTDGSMKICCAQNENLQLKKDDGFGNIATKWESLGWIKQKEVAEKLFR